MAESTKPTKAKGGKKKVGGLPPWGWAATGAAVYGVYYLYKKHQSNVAGAALTTPAVTTPVDTNGVGSAIIPSTEVTPTTSPTLADFRARFLAQATNPKGGNLSPAQAQQIYNAVMGGNVLNGKLATIASNILANLYSGGHVPAGVPNIVHVGSATNGAVTTTHTPSSAYVPPAVVLNPPRKNAPVSVKSAPKQSKPPKQKPKPSPKGAVGAIPGFLSSPGGLQTGGNRPAPPKPPKKNKPGGINPIAGAVGAIGYGGASTAGADVAVAAPGILSEIGSGLSFVGSGILDMTEIAGTWIATEAV